MAQSTAYFFYRTPFGSITLCSDGLAINKLLFGEHKQPGQLKPLEITNTAATEILEYFSGKRSVFDLPLAPAGSEFQKMVWKALDNIPYGQTRTAAELGEIIGKPTALRAIGTALAQNPIPILIPSHRIVTPRGKALGTGNQTTWKTALLELERRNS